MVALTKSQPIHKEYQDDYAVGKLTNNGYEDGELSSLDCLKMMTEVITCLIIIAFIFDL